jgi:hypothetical protein
MLACPERPLGRCPYVEQNLVSVKGRLVWWGVLLFSIFWLFGWIKQQGPELQGFDLIGVLISLVFISISSYGALHTRVQLYNPNSKTRLIRTTLLGIELERTLITGAESVPTKLVLSQQLALPPSVTKLAATNLKKVKTQQAVHIFRAALAGLLVQRLIQIHRFQKHTARWWQEFKRVENVYVITTTKNADLYSIKGALERKIIKVLISWKEREEAGEWPDGTPIYELIRAIYGTDVVSPADWVVNLVAKDAVAQGLGRFKRWPRKRFDLDTPHADRFRAERTIVNELSSQLAQRQPDLSHTLNSDLERAIRSRERKAQYDQY